MKNLFQKSEYEIQPLEQMHHIKMDMSNKDTEPSPTWWEHYTPDQTLTNFSDHAHYITLRLLGSQMLSLNKHVEKLLLKSIIIIQENFEMASKYSYE